MLLALLGWSAWFAVCNRYEFAPPLDPLAFACGWLLSAILAGRVLRRVAWPLFAQASCIGMYLLLIHRGMGEGAAQVLFLAASVAVVAAAFRTTTRVSDA
ncbi:hypothetical protein [Stenotrophomonas pictorum]|uniref:hypothetical protein n=1 Tax=Stenotrophomonas pictorum TaxID=86184 RepID=UPI0012FD2384|nr:hypothetical protein [Stenotrophomonas pictorum]